MERRKTRAVKAGGVYIGGGHPITVQSMLGTKTEDVEACVKSIERLEAAGCEIVRLAVADMRAVFALHEIKNKTRLPIVADIHFDYRLAIESAAAGADKIRINPGNIGSSDRVKAVAAACAARGIPIRIGVNGGSLEQKLLEKHGGRTPQALAESALSQAAVLEACGFGDIVLSVKSSDVAVMVKAYELLAESCDYPLHIGVTEAGTARMGIIKSAAGLGALLLKGIGDTLRVSLTESPEEEARAGADILRALGIRRDRPEIISCPTCGRTRIDLISLAKRVEAAVADIERPIKIAVMGCAVNGPGEAADADIGIAGGAGEGLIFKKGKIIKKVPEDRLLEELIKEIKAE